MDIKIRLSVQKFIRENDCGGKKKKRGGGLESHGFEMQVWSQVQEGQKNESLGAGIFTCCDVLKQFQQGPQGI